MGPEPLTPAEFAVAPGWLNRERILWLTLLLTLAALGLRFCRLGHQSFWTDEAASVVTARAPLDQIARQSAEMNNSLPTYFLLLRLVLGEAKANVEFRARALSAIAGALSVPLLVGLVYLWRRDGWAALVAGLLLAVNPLHLWYSQETRAYAVMLFFGLLSLVCFEMARSSHASGLGWWAGYLLAAVAAVALHKTALIFPAACGLWDAWRVLRGRGRLKELLIHVGALTVALGVLSLKSFPPGADVGRPSSGAELVYTFMTFVGGYSFGPSLTEIQSYGGWGAVTRHWAQAGVLGVVLAVVGLWCVLDLRLVVSRKETTLLVLAVATAAAGALFSAFPYNVRYTLPGLIGFLALVAGVLTRPGRRWAARLSIAAVLVVGLWADGQWFFSAAYRKGDSRGVARWLVENAGRVQTWTVLPTYLRLSLEWYLGDHPAVAARLLEAKSPQTTAFPPVPDALIIGRRHHVRQPDDLIAAYRVSAGEVQTNTSFAGFEIYWRAGKLRAPESAATP